MPTVDTGGLVPAKVDLEHWWSSPASSSCRDPPYFLLSVAQDWKLTKGEVSADKIPQGKVAVSVTTINYGGG